MMIEKEKILKPCPFCGQSPTTKVEVTQMGGNKDQINFLIYCPDCKYVVKNIYLDITPSNICDFSKVEETMLKIINMWNTRVIK